MKTRFPPSPTGFLHIGSLRTALFAYLAAKKAGGTFLLRIEDTDRERFVEGSIKNILEILEWANIKVDEGVVLEEDKIGGRGESGPYIQSERTDIYLEKIQELLNNDKAYYCFCSKERLGELRKLQELNKEATGYDGHCRKLVKEDVEERLKKKEAYVVRLKMPTEGETILNDIVRGRVEFKNSLIDDQVLLKSDGFPTYHLAVVVDDYLMGVTDVIRGEDWLSSTPKHIVLYEAFGWAMPSYAHLPLLVNEQKAKLSKRHGDVSVEDFKEKGYLPEALVNFVAFLGWNPGGEKEIFSLAELEKEFDLTRVGKAAAVFNREKLSWYNKQYIMEMTPAELAKRSESFFNNAGINVDNVRLDMVVALEQGRASTLLEIVENTGFIFADKLDYEPELLVWKKSTAQDAKDKLTELFEVLNSLEGEWSKESIEHKVFSWLEERGYGKGEVLWPMRVALSGLKNSPGPTEIAGVLGKENVLGRVKAGIAKL